MAIRAHTSLSENLFWKKHLFLCLRCLYNKIWADSPVYGPSRSRAPFRRPSVPPSVSPSLKLFTRPVGRGVSNGIEDGRRLPALRVGHTQNGRKAVSGVHRQGIEGSGMAGQGDTLGSPWIPLAIRACCLLIFSLWPLNSEGVIFVFA
jgi:hypothetical protein